MNRANKPAALTSRVAYASALVVLVSFAAARVRAADTEKCQLFSDGVQAQAKELTALNLKIAELKPVLLHCDANETMIERIAIRRFRARELTYFLLVDPGSLRTELARESCYRCAPIEFESLEHTRYGSAVSRLAKDYKRNKAKHALLNAGLKASETEMHGAIVTADLCPTVKPMNRAFFEEVEGLQNQAPVALSVSGLWMDHHKADLDWLKDQVRGEKLDVTWVNHSHHHAFRPDKSTDGNFMLLPKMNIEDEIVTNERIMIENGLTPSVFFRFPALVSDPALMEGVKKHMLIPLAANAWLNKGEQPHDHSIILVHANGNEKGGLKRFRKLADEKQLPLPIIPLLLAPRSEPLNTPVTATKLETK
jgi:hypothetical protein